MGRHVRKKQKTKHEDAREEKQKVNLDDMVIQISLMAKSTKRKVR